MFSEEVKDVSTTIKGSVVKFLIILMSHWKMSAFQSKAVTSLIKDWWSERKLHYLTTSLIFGSNVKNGLMKKNAPILHLMRWAELKDFNSQLCHWLIVLEKHLSLSLI